MAFSLVVYQGDSASWAFKFWQDRERTIPVDLTDVTAKAEIRDRPGGNLMLPLPLTITPPNLVVAALTSTDSRKLTRRNGVWDMQFTLADGTVSTVVSGHVHVTPDVTDSAA